MALNVWPVKAVERRAIRKANYLANKDLFAVEQHCSLYLCLFQLIGPISGVFHLQFLNHILLQGAFLSDALKFLKALNSNSMAVLLPATSNS